MSPSPTATCRSLAARVARAAALLGTLAVTGGLGAMTAPALAAECPNEQLRIESNSTRLPECRAYELVTPAYKEGFAPSGGFKFTDDGSFAYTSNGNFAGDGLGGKDNEYVARRSPSGWQSTSLNPSGPDYFSLGEPRAISTDLRSVLWDMRLADESTELASWYLREPDGTFTRIGPSINPETAPPGTPGVGGPGGQQTVEAVSADLSHVVFGLSEYVGTGNESPQPLAVDNVGTAVDNVGPASGANGISTDGRVVFFTAGGEPDGQVWARINETTSIHASASECTRASGDPGGVCNAPAEAHYAGAASDGSRVFFTTTQQLVNGDTNQTNDLYACDIPPGTPAPVGLVNPCESLLDLSGTSPAANVEDLVRVFGYPNYVSENGSRVYFLATGALATNTDAAGERAVSGNHNLYVSEIDAAHPGGETTFVAKLQSNDLGDAQTTADGRYLLFTTASQLVAGDTDEARDVYRYDADTGSLLRLSTDTDGSGGNEPGAEASPSIYSHGKAMSADGSTVIFRTTESLSPADTNGTSDWYEWHDGRVSLISSGRPSLGNESEFAGISPSGTDIYFTATSPLTPGDLDTNPDVYDARIDGGFSLSHAEQCAGEACQGTAAPQPQPSGAPASATFSGTGNLAPPPQAAATKPRPKPLTRAQKLTRALRACRSKHKRAKRSACEKRARNTYGRSK
jgi:hypothetical protein